MNWAFFLIVLAIGIIAFLVVAARRGNREHNEIWDQIRDIFGHGSSNEKSRLSRTADADFLWCDGYKYAGFVESKSRGILFRRFFHTQNDELVVFPWDQISQIRTPVEGPVWYELEFKNANDLPGAVRFDCPIDLYKAFRQQQQ